MALAVEKEENTHSKYINKVRRGEGAQGFLENEEPQTSTKV